MDRSSDGVGKKLSIAAVTENSMGGKSLPYGVATLTSRTTESYDGVFACPEEGVSIFDAYDKFQSWVDGTNGVNDTWYMNPSPTDLDANVLTYRHIKDGTVIGVLKF